MSVCIGIENCKKDCTNTQIEKWRNLLEIWQDEKIYAESSQQENSNNQNFLENFLAGFESFFAARKRESLRIKMD